MARERVELCGVMLFAWQTEEEKFLYDMEVRRKKLVQSHLTIGLVAGRDRLV